MKVCRPTPDILTFSFPVSIIILCEAQAFNMSVGKSVSFHTIFYPTLSLPVNIIILCEAQAFKVGAGDTVVLRTVYKPACNVYAQCYVFITQNTNEL